MLCARLRWTDPLYLACFQPALIFSHRTVAFRWSFKSPCMTAKIEGISDHFSACSVHCPADEFYVTVLKCVPIFMLSHEWIHFPLQFTTGFSNFDILLITFSPCLVFSSSRKCETLGYWSAMFSNNNDEDRPHQAYWVYGIFKKVWHLFTLSKNTVKLPSSSFDFFVSAVFDLFPSHLFFFICCLTIYKLYPPAKRRVSPKRSLAAV